MSPRNRWEIQFERAFGAEWSCLPDGIVRPRDERDPTLNHSKLEDTVLNAEVSHLWSPARSARSAVWGVVEYMHGIASANGWDAVDCVFTGALAFPQRPGSRKNYWVYIRYCDAQIKGGTE